MPHRWNEENILSYESSARFDETAQELAVPSPKSFSVQNVDGACCFQRIARFRNLPFRRIIRLLPVKGDLYDFVDKYHVPKPAMSDDDLEFHGPLGDVSDDAPDLEGNEFYIRARQGQRLFRTSLSTFPVSNVKLGVHDGVIGALLDKLFSLTPLDFATTGAEDVASDVDDNRPLHDDGSVFMPVAYLDPDLDVVHDLDGRPWAFDGELHCVRAFYTNWRELRSQMTVRNGRLNRAHLILFAALRVSCILEALQPISVRNIDAHKYNIRGYLLAILNVAMPYIRLFKLLVSLISPSEGDDIACDSITGDNAILVRCSPLGIRVAVSTDGISLRDLIIKAILEEADSLDMTGCLEEIEFLSYGHNSSLISIFLSAIKGIAHGPSARKDKTLESVRAIIALSQNSPLGAVRDSLVSRNNGLKLGIDALLEGSNGNVDKIAEMLAAFRGGDENAARDDIMKIATMSEFGVFGDEGDDDDSSELKPNSDYELYTLHLPGQSSVVLKRRRTAVGILSVIEGKFHFSGTNGAALGVMTVYKAFQDEDATSEDRALGSGFTIEFHESECDAAMVANVCLSNGFGAQAGLFVLNHILFGDVTIRETENPSYLRQAKQSKNGERIFSFLHPAVTNRLGVFRAKVGGKEVISFDGEKVVGIYEREIPTPLGFFHPVTDEEKEIVFSDAPINLGKVFLA